MKSKALTLKLVQEIIRLVRGNLPLTEGIQELASVSQPPFRQTAQRLAKDLSEGRPLGDALAPDQTQAGKLLSSAIELGLYCGRLDSTLESWTQYILSHHRHRSRLAVEMLYPIALVLIAICSLVYCTYSLVPHYDEAFQALVDYRPTWMAWLKWTRSHLWVLGCLMSLTMILPLAGIVLARWRRNRWGMPNDRTVRFYLHAHAARLASWAVNTGQPISNLLPMLTSGLTTCPANSAGRVTSEAIGNETFAVLSSVQANALPVPEAHLLLQTLAEQLQASGDFSSQRDARWLPMVISLIVGVVVAFSYVLLIYLPWVVLFCYISSPDLS